jgi:hypothetical protein
MRGGSAIEWTLLAQVSTDPAPAEMARATAVLVALAASTFVVAAIEGAVIAEPVVGAVDGLPGRPASGPARHDSVMETLTRVPAGAAKWRLRVMCRRLRSPQQRKHGGDRYNRCAQQPSPRVCRA